MLLNFDQIEEKVIPKMRGGEGEMITRMFVNEDTKIMRGCLTPRQHHRPAHPRD